MAKFSKFRLNFAPAFPLSSISLLRSWIAYAEPFLAPLSLFPVSTSLHCWLSSRPLPCPLSLSLAQVLSWVGILVSDLQIQGSLNDTQVKGPGADNHTASEVARIYQARGRKWLRNRRVLAEMLRGLEPESENEPCKVANLTETAGRDRRTDR